MPDLVKFDRERATLYAPVMISTNKQVSAVSPTFASARWVLIDCGDLPIRAR